MSTTSEVGTLVSELRRLDAAATPGPWFVGGGDDGLCIGSSYVTSDSSVAGEDHWGWPSDRRDVIAVTFMDTPAVAGSPKGWENAYLIAAMRSGVPVLCDSLATAWTRIDALRACLTDLVKECDAGDQRPAALSDALSRARREIESR